MLANSSAAIGERAMRSRAFMATSCACERRRVADARPSPWRRCLGSAPFVHSALDLVAEALDLLQHQLELVLGAGELRAPGG